MKLYELYEQYLEADKDFRDSVKKRDKALGEHSIKEISMAEITKKFPFIEPYQREVEEKWMVTSVLKDTLSRHLENKVYKLLNGKYLTFVSEGYFSELEEYVDQLSEEDFRSVIKVINERSIENIPF